MKRANVSPPTYTQTPNVLFDLMGDMTESELKVCMAIIRQTFGWHKRGDKLSLSQLMKITGLSKNSVLAGINDAMDRGIITRIVHGDSYIYSLVVQNLNQGSVDFEPEVVQNLNMPSSNFEPLVVQNLNTQKKGKKLSKETPTTKESECGETPPHSGGGGGVNLTQTTDTERWLLSQDVSPKAAKEFSSYPLAVLKADFLRLAATGAGVGAIIQRWRVAPPVEATPESAAPTGRAIIASATWVPEDIRKKWLDLHDSTRIADRPLVIRDFSAKYSEATYAATV